MGYYGKELITGIEFGSDKICVAHGIRDEAGNIEALSFASKPAEGSVNKGEIVDRNAALRILSSVLEVSEKNLPGSLDRTRNSVYFLINGRHVVSRRGEGAVQIYEKDKKITRAHVEEAIRRAQNIELPPDQTYVSMYDSYFVLDGRNREGNPVGRLADRLSANIHIITAGKQQVELVRSLLRELGFEQEAHPVCTSIADVFGVMTMDEREQGALVFDFGATVSSYAVIQHDGVLLTGSIPVGVVNVANDLSLALDLPFDFCMDFLRASTLDKLREKGSNFLEYRTRGATERVRRIPLDSFEKVMDLRIRETFQFMKEILLRAGLARALRAGAVLTGGGSMIPSAMQMFQDLMGVTVRRGEPLGITGALSSFRSPMPCYAAVLGLLKHVADLDPAAPGDPAGSVRDAVERFADRVLNLFHSKK